MCPSMACTRRAGEANSSVAMQNRAVRHTMEEELTIAKAVEQILTGISDENELSTIRSVLVPPRQTTCGAAFPSKGEPIPCWIVAELEQTLLGMVACVYSDELVSGSNCHWGYAAVERDYFLGETAWSKDLKSALLEWPDYRDCWFQPKKESVGCEFDWYACDARGNVALFSTAGFGEIPEIVFSALYEYAMVDAYFSLDRSSLKITPAAWGTREVFGKHSDNGLFVYDWQHWSGPYKCIEKPSFPLNIESIEKCVQQPLKMLKFGGVDFSRQDQIYPQNWHECWQVKR